MIYPIVKFGNPVLEKPAEPVTVFDSHLKKLVDDMFESMYAAHGVGLAAPQIGISKRLAVIDVTFKEDPDAKLVIVNPEIIRTEGRHTQNEGCLSIPEFREPVSRARKVTIRAQDVNGKWFEKTGEDLAGPRFPARNRSPERQAVHQPHQRSQAGLYEAQDPQADESGRMVGKAALGRRTSDVRHNLRASVGLRPRSEV